MVLIVEVEAIAITGKSYSFFLNIRIVAQENQSMTSTLQTFNVLYVAKPI